MRVVTDRNQQVARIDYESDAEIAGEIEERIIAEIRKHATRCSAIIVSDYLKGCVTRQVMQAAVTAGAERGAPVLVDPKIPHLDYYGGATIVTPNHHEAEAATHRRVRSEEEARDAARLFRERAGCQHVLMTRGDQGIWLLSSGMEGHLPAAAREVADVTGAGDTVIATLAVALAAGATHRRGRPPRERSGRDRRRQVRSRDGIDGGIARGDRFAGGSLIIGVGRVLNVGPAISGGSHVVERGFSPRVVQADACALTRRPTAIASIPTSRATESRPPPALHPQ